MANATTDIKIGDMTITVAMFNGTQEVGIAVGIDPALDPTLKLPFNGVRHLNMLASLKLVSEMPLSKKNDRMKEVMYCCAWACYNYRLIAKRIVDGADIWDGDVYDIRDEIAITQPDVDYYKSKAAEFTKGKYLTLVLATKANWWMMNHHTGQNIATGYVRKIIDSNFGDLDVEDMTQIAHAVGHWASTRKVLNLMGIGGVGDTSDVLSEELFPGKVLFSDDFKLRIQSLPAGTHRLAVAEAAARKLGLSPLVVACPGALDFVSLPGLVVAIKRSPASYHIGAQYLTGRRREEYDDNIHETVMGRLGTFVRVMYGRSTLAKSPHFSEVRVASYSDFDTEWDTLLKSYKAASAKATMLGASIVKHIGNIATYSAINKLIEAFIPEGPARDAKRRNMYELIEKLSAETGIPIGEERPVMELVIASPVTRAGKRTAAQMYEAGPTTSAGAESVDDESETAEPPVIVEPPPKKTKGTGRSKR